MNRFQALIRPGRTLLLPGVHDALSARMAEQLGFEGLCVGGAAVGIMQFALPDIGLQSFGEYRDCVGRIQSGSKLPIMLDAEDGFGDAKSVTRTVRTFEQMGVDALILEDLLPFVAGKPPRTLPLAEATAKLEAALRARRSSDTWIVGRTDVAHAGDHAAVAQRAQRFEEIGVDAVLATGLRDLDDMRRLRDRVQVPLIALVVQTKPWVAPSLKEASHAGYEILMHAASLMLQVVGATREGLTSLRDRDQPIWPSLAPTLEGMSELLCTGAWNSIDISAEMSMATTKRNP